jgi:hypothetical protein
MPAQTCSRSNPFGVRTRAAWVEQHIDECILTPVDVREALRLQRLAQPALDGLRLGKFGAHKQYVAFMRYAHLTMCRAGASSKAETIHVWWRTQKFWAKLAQSRVTLNVRRVYFCDETFALKETVRM